MKSPADRTVKIIINTFTIEFYTETLNLFTYKMMNRDIVLT